jgi:hypothetical protein
LHPGLLQQRSVAARSIEHVSISVMNQSFSRRSLFDRHAYPHPISLVGAKLAVEQIGRGLCRLSMCNADAKAPLSVGLDTYLCAKTCHTVFANAHALHEQLFPCLDRTVRATTVLMQHFDLLEQRHILLTAYARRSL